MPGKLVVSGFCTAWAVVIAAGAVLQLLTGAPPARAQAPDCPPGWVCPGAPESAPEPDCPSGWDCSPEQEQQEPSSGMSEAELQLRLELMQRSMGFGGIFGPALQDWLNAPSAPDHGCGGYTDYAARQACGAGDRWAADRLQQDRSTSEERDWYNR